MNESQSDLIQRIHASEHHAVVAVTGGGSRAVADLLAVPGASRTVLEAVVPYSSTSLAEWLHGRPEQFCSPATARQMAMAAYRRGVHLRRAERPEIDPIFAPWPVVGLGCTASLLSDRPKRGPHRVHLAAQTASATIVRSLELTKEARARVEEERVVAALIIDLIAEACEVGERPPVHLLPGETVAAHRTDAPPEWQDLLAGESARTSVRPGFAWRDDPPRAVFPGSFHPLHAGHLRMAEIAAAKLGVPVDFELSIENVEKPPLDFEEMTSRATQFSNETRIWFTRAPRMTQKAGLFPEATIVCGIDTLLRVADPRFAAGSEATRDQDIAQIANLGCRFLVFGRQTPRGFETLDNVSIPEALRRISTGVPESEFREDVCSTDVRKMMNDE
jgi:hypothetical protein